MGDELSGPFRSLMEFARDEAIRLGHPYVGTEHQLLGLLRARDTAAIELIEAAGTTVEHIRDAVEAAIPRGAALPVSPDAALPYTSRAKRVLAFAKTEAPADGSGTSAGRRLLRALFREDQNVAAHVLRAAGVDSA
jgi:ATP-dependent Clp protease ATP-binding subunit ClpC